jgi:hypothetical protein
MVEDYFALREMPAEYAPADRAEKIAKFEAMLKPHLPLQADTTPATPPQKMVPAQPPRTQTSSLQPPKPSSPPPPSA